SLLVVIIWLLFYLRNNAFKNYYRLDRWYQAKEFLILLLIVSLSTTYYISFAYGARAGVKNITTSSQFVKEANIVNHAMAYLPTDSIDYFVLNACDNKEKGKTIFNLSEVDRVVTATAYEVDTSYKALVNDSLIKAACERPDAFSYKNYCSDFLILSFPGIVSQRDMFKQKQKWLLQHAADSVYKLLEAFKAICRKYEVENNISIDTFSNKAFATPQNNISVLIDNRSYDRSPRHAYLNTQALRSVFDFIYKCHGASDTENERDMNILIFSAYTCISLTLLLLCYRRFSRKVFLFSIIGSIVWAVIIILIMSRSSGNSSSFSELCMTLCAVFLITGLINLKAQKQKLVTGALLCWHVYLIPFFFLLLSSIFNNYYQEQESAFYRNGYNMDATMIMSEKYPISSWIHAHFTEIAFMNLCVVIIYIMFIFNKLAKSWHVTPEE
ncbi:MAG TPA: hypothetical protein VNS32_15955, partial [Flavisolibacter sp.]|nr:hypothetical protein [Flavisolibacter sp.]